MKSSQQETAWSKGGPNLSFKPTQQTTQKPKLPITKSALNLQSTRGVERKMEVLNSSKTKPLKKTGSSMFDIVENVPKEESTSNQTGLNFKNTILGVKSAENPSENQSSVATSSEEKSSYANRTGNPSVSKRFSNLQTSKNYSTLLTRGRTDGKPTSSRFQKSGPGERSVRNRQNKSAFGNNTTYSPPLNARDRDKDREERESERIRREKKFNSISKIRFTVDVLLAMNEENATKTKAIMPGDEEDLEHFEGLFRDANDPRKPALKEDFDMKQFTTDWYEALKKERAERAKRYQQTHGSDTRSTARSGGSNHASPWRKPETPSWNKEDTEPLDLEQLSKMSARLGAGHSNPNPVPGQPSETHFNLADMSAQSNRFDREIKGNKPAKEEKIPEMPSFFGSNTLSPKSSDDLLDGALEDDLSRPPEEEIIPESQGIVVEDASPDDSSFPQATQENPLREQMKNQFDFGLREEQPSRSLMNESQERRLRMQPQEDVEMQRRQLMIERQMQYKEAQELAKRKAQQQQQQQQMWDMNARHQNPTARLQPNFPSDGFQNQYNQPPQHRSMPSAQGGRFQVDDILGGQHQPVRRPDPYGRQPQQQFPEQHLSEREIYAQRNHSLSRHSSHSIPPQPFHPPQPAAPTERPQYRLIQGFWFYRDPQGNVRGPFSSKQMRQWFERKFFAENLLITRHEATNAYAPLKHYFPDYSTAFLEKFIPPAPIQPQQHQYSSQYDPRVQNGGSLAPRFRAEPQIPPIHQSQQRFDNQYMNDLGRNFARQPAPSQKNEFEFDLGRNFGRDSGLGDQAPRNLSQEANRASVESIDAPEKKLNLDSLSSGMKATNLSSKEPEDSGASDVFIMEPTVEKQTSGSPLSSSSSKSRSDAKSSLAAKNLKQMLGVGAGSIQSVATSEKKTKKASKTQPKDHAPKIKPMVTADDERKNNFAPKQNAWKKVAPPTSSNPSLKEIQQEEERKMRQEVLQGSYTSSQTKVWANLVAKNSGAVGQHPGSVDYPQLSGTTARNQFQQSQMGGSAFSSQRQAGAGHIKPQESNYLLQWCTEQCRNLKIRISDPGTFLEFCLGLDSPAEVREYFRDNLGSTPEISRFATEFLNLKAKIKQQKGFVTVSKGKKK